MVGPLFSTDSCNRHPIWFQLLKHLRNECDCGMGSSILRGVLVSLDYGNSESLLRLFHSLKYCFSCAVFIKGLSRFLLCSPFNFSLLSITICVDELCRLYHVEREDSDENDGRKILPPWENFQGRAYINTFLVFAGKLYAGLNIFITGFIGFL